MESIWPERRPKDSAAALRQLVHEIRRRVGGDPTEIPIVILRDRVYRLDWSCVWVDVAEFRKALEAAKRSSDPEPHLRRALGLYGGDFCEGAFYGWTEAMRYELERGFIAAAIRLADLLIETGRADEAGQVLDRALVVDPYSDALVRRAMMVDAKSIGPVAALQRFERFEARLREDLGLEPAPETVQLRRSLVGPGADR